MLAQVIKAEGIYNELLPLHRPEKRPGEDLLAAARAWSEAVWQSAQQSGPVKLSGDEVEKGLNLILYPVFICGVHRSGTTLVRDLLDNHPDLVVLPSEGTYYTNLEHKILALPEDEQPAFFGKEWLRRLANPINQPPYWLLGRSNENGSPYIEFARYLMSWWQVVNHKKGTQYPHSVVMLAYASCTDRLSSTHWVDKTPTNERFLGRIRREFSDAKIIHLVRHPLAILASRKKLDPSFNIRKILIDIRYSFRIALKQSSLKDPAYFLIPYEELCAAPANYISGLAKFLNISNTESLFQPSVAGFPTMANSSFKKQSVSGQIHKWDRSLEEDVLTNLEKQLSATCVGGLSRKLSYPVEKNNFFRSVYLRVKYFL